MMPTRTPINNFEAILIAYALGALTALSFRMYGAYIERCTKEKR